MAFNTKCRLNSPRRSTVCYRCSNVNLLLYSTIAVHRGILKSLAITNTRIIEIFFTFEQVSSRTTEQILKTNTFYASGKIFLCSCHFKSDYRRIHHVKIANLIEYILQKIEKNCSSLTRFLPKILLRQSKLHTHCILNKIGQLKIAVNNHMRDDPWHTLVTYTVSEIETQF